MRTEAYTRTRRTRNVIKRRRQLAGRTVVLLAATVSAVVLLASGMTTASEDVDEATIVRTTAEPATTIEPTAEVHLIIEQEDEQEEFTETVEQEYSTEQMLAEGYISDYISLSYELQIVAREAAEAFDVPYTLLLAVMFCESSYQTDAVNQAGTCWGLMQVNQINFDWLMDELSEFGVTDIQNSPEDNITAGAYLLGDLLARYQDENKALMCYNCGEGGAKNLFKQGYCSTSYSRGVIEFAKELDNAGILPNGKY